MLTGWVTVLVTGMVLMSGCTGTEHPGTTPVATPNPPVVDETVPVTPSLTPAVPPAPAPAPGPLTIQIPRDPIIGSWLNGMVFHEDGTVGSDGSTTWRVNRNGNYSYFVVSDVPSRGAANQRNVTSAEWRYNPFSDTIYRRGSSDAFSRKIPTVNPTAIPAMTTMQTPAPALPVTAAPVTPLSPLPPSTTPVPTPAVPPATAPVTATAVPTSKAPVTIKTAVPATAIPVTTATAVPTGKAPVTIKTAVPATAIPVTTATAVPPAVAGDTGSLLIHTGGLGNDVSVFIAREGAPVPPLTGLYDPFGIVVQDQISGYLRVKIFPDGNSEMVSLPVGNYIVYLPDKNGGQPEQQSVTINAHCTSEIAFSGYAYRASSGGGCGG